MTLPTQTEPTEYVIRAATAADAQTIKRIVRAEPLDPNAIQWEYFLVLEVTEQGQKRIASIGMVRPEGDVHEIDSVATRPEYRGHGYAPALVRALMDKAPRPLYLLAETKLIAFYERLGFRLFDSTDAPRVMSDQAAWVNKWFGGRTTYHVMGITE